MNSSMMFFSVHDCRGLCGHGKFWVLFPGDVFHYRFLFPGLLGQVFLHSSYGKDPVSHLVGGFFLTLDHLGNLFFVPFPIQLSSTSPSVCWEFRHPSHLCVVIRFLWSDNRKWGAAFYWGWMTKAEQTLLDLCCWYITQPVKGNFNKLGNSGITKGN